ncbi:hypothetical protein JTE90_025876 [Oedothorax gibbosus]|uniref:Uncharacterized protein n=1 Tax=Oedothorax gibbosus TaxID=931172 RepID=A0AAV6UM51_9ARAC|nr:hypothetical protein JTE90_025876 [Oedothorax gibbosus]
MSPIRPPHTITMAVTEEEVCQLITSSNRGSRVEGALYGGSIDALETQRPFFSYFEEGKKRFGGGRKEFGRKQTGTTLSESVI